ncbi:hypothetical protein ACIRD2_25920 [Streptomyces sp. NPDC093595]|uniref:hypothetical protein n=1 Tax=Streptomyces sp. NPDC093595 TaxID=3366045 RepID=UPI003824615B
MRNSPQDRLADVAAAAVEVAVESAAAGTYTGGVGRALSAVIAKVGARITVDAELRGFSSGWQEAVAALTAEPPAPTAHAPVFRMPGRPGGAEPT